MTTPLQETLVETTEIDRIIEKIYPQLVDEQTTSVIVSLISMVIMAMHPHLNGEQLVKAVEEAAQILVTVGIQIPDTKGSIQIAH